MKNDAKSNYRPDNRNFQDTPKEIDSEESKSNEDPNKNLCLANKGFPHYDKKNDSNADNAWSNYDDDKKNSELEGYGEGIESDSDVPKSPNNSDDDIKNADKKGVVVDTDMGQMVIEQNPNRNE